VTARITNARRFTLASRQVVEIEDWNCGWRNVSREASGRDGMFWNGCVGLVGRACCNVEEQFRGRGEDLAELVVTCWWLVGLGAANFESDLGSSAAGDVGQDAQSACVVLEGQA
jgi:hypothetical protein